MEKRAVDCENTLPLNAIHCQVRLDDKGRITLHFKITFPKTQKGCHSPDNNGF